MEGAPKRIESESIPIDPEYELDPEQQSELRETLVSVGAMSRRSFLTGAAATFAAASLKPDKAFANVETSPRPKERPEYVNPIEQIEYQKIQEHSKKAMTEVITKAHYLQTPEGAFVKDKKGRAIGKILAQVLGTTVPGAGFSNETPHVTDGFSKVWREEAERASSRELGLPETEIELDTSNWIEIKHLAKKMGRYPKSILEGVLYFGTEEVPNSGLNKMEYLRENFFIPNEQVPNEVAQEMRYFGLGIAGEETRFVESSVSAAYAHTTFQFLPSTWEGMGYPPFSAYPDGMPPYSIQVEAFCKHCGNIYNELHTEKTASQLELISTLFSSPQEYYQYFLAPLMINAYNAGAGTMRAAVDHFVQSETFHTLSQKDGQNGYDIFYSLSELAHESNEGALTNYKDWAKNYPTSVMAYAKLLNEVLDRNARHSM